ncbi:MAG TPA: NAD+ synthase [Pseudomonadales bacterium]|nr:NAD+ synthase [Pseudomonadales bacterium]
MATKLRLAIAQQNFLVGDIQGNLEKIIQAAMTARDQHQADAIVFPELALTGYPPEDLLLRPSLQIRVEKALLQLRARVSGITVIVGYPRQEQGLLYNMAGVFADGHMLAEYRKQMLPNYQVFDEKRYFEAGCTATVVELKGIPVGLTICEDIWHRGPALQAANMGAKLIVNLNASPFHKNKDAERKGVLQQRIHENGVPIVYCNLVGGQDELVFDGGSMVMSASGEVTAQMAFFEEEIRCVEFEFDGQCAPVKSGLSEVPDLEASVYQALVLGVRDYVNKNGFKGVVLGLSGGIDSALTLAVAVDALGPERVEAVMMPFRYTSQMSLEDAEAEARVLGVNYLVKPIEPMFNAFMAALKDEFAGMAVDNTEQNLQARSRGVLLMAISNKKGFLVLTTGNKSEMAVGYATLYGDMAGGFDVLKDVPKTLVFRLCEYRNRISPVIPQRVIDRPPSAELAPDQKDEDNLPPYPVLDAILERYIEQDMSLDAIVKDGFDADTVRKVIRLVDLNEYKRRQAAVGVRITPRGFGRDRRYPITCRWPAGE